MITAITSDKERRHSTLQSPAAAAMSDGTILKADKDFTKEVDALLPDAEKLAKVEKLDSSTTLPY